MLQNKFNGLSSDSIFPSDLSYKINSTVYHQITFSHQIYKIQYKLNGLSSDSIFSSDLFYKINSMVHHQIVFSHQIYPTK